MENQKSALGLDGNVTALIGYIIGIVALVLIFIEKDNKFVRFHAIQSVLWSVIFVVSIIVLLIVGGIVSVVLAQISGLLGTIVSLVMILLYVGLFFGFIGGLLFAAIKAFGGGETKLPIVGSMADKWA